MEMPTLLLAFSTVCYWSVLAGNREKQSPHISACTVKPDSLVIHTLTLFVAILKVLGVWHKNGAEVHPACLLPKLSNPDPSAMEEMVWQVYEFSFTFITFVWHFVNFKSTRSLDGSEFLALVCSRWEPASVLSRGLLVKGHIGEATHAWRNL